MGKAKVKTTKNDASVADFLSSIGDDEKREDCNRIAKIMRDATGDAGKMWGSSIVGFGEYHYKYKSGREGDWMKIGFSPRKQAITLYIMDGFEKRDGLMKKLGKHKTGKSCLYIKRLSDVDMETLQELIAQSLNFIDQKYGGN